jgi:hypothetical protein
VCSVPRLRVTSSQTDPALLLLNVERINMQSVEQLLVEIQHWLHKGLSNFPRAGATFKFTRDYKYGHFNEKLLKFISNINKLSLLLLRSFYVTHCISLTESVIVESFYTFRFINHARSAVTLCWCHSNASLQVFISKTRPSSWFHVST